MDVVSKKKQGTPYQKAHARPRANWRQRYVTDDVFRACIADSQKEVPERAEQRMIFEALARLQ